MNKLLLFTLLLATSARADVERARALMQQGAFAESATI